MACVLDREQPGFRACRLDVARLRHRARYLRGGVGQRLGRDHPGIGVLSVVPVQLATTRRGAGLRIILASGADVGRATPGKDPSLWIDRIVRLRLVADLDDGPGCRLRHWDPVGAGHAGDIVGGPRWNLCRMVVWGLAMQHLHDQVSRFSSSVHWRCLRSWRWPLRWPIGSGTLRTRDPAAGEAASCVHPSGSASRVLPESMTLATMRSSICWIRSSEGADSPRSGTMAGP